MRLTRILPIPLLILLLTGSAVPTGAATTNLNGYWEGVIGGNKHNDEYPWNIWRPSQYYEFKILSSISDRSEAWVKFGARYNKDNSGEPQPNFLFQEGHIKFRQESDGKGFESFIFLREKRYWIGNHLLELVNDDNASSDGNAQGIRFDSWWGKWNLTYVLSDFSSQGDDDAHIVRMIRRLGSGGSYIGGTLLRRVKRNQASQYNLVRSFDFQWITRLLDLSLEFADSELPSEIQDGGWDKNALKHGAFGHAIEQFLPDDSALRAEVRNLTMGSHKLGHYTINAGYWRHGQDFRNELGNDNSNRVGHFFHTYYRVPQRAITYTSSWGREEYIISRVFGLGDDGVELWTNDPKYWFNHNLYVEFINGFKAGLSHNRTDESFLGRDYKHHDWLFELVVENRLAWLKTQFKIKDWNTHNEKQIFGVETTINLNSTWKWYNRFMVASDAVAARYMIFTQLQFRPFDNMEALLSYGPEWYGDWGELTNDGDFESNGRMYEEFKLLFKTWF